MSKPGRTGHPGSSAGAKLNALFSWTTDAVPVRAGRIKKILKRLGPGVIAGAANDDPCAIGTYAQIGASFGIASLWTAPFTIPMISVVTYLCAKIGMVTGVGLVAAIRQHYPRALLYPLVVFLVVANVIEAAADIGAVAASLNLLVPVPISALVVVVTVMVLVLQIWGAYRLIDRIFRWLAMALFAYVAAAVLIRLDPYLVLKGTFVPTVSFNADVLTLMVAVVGTRFSPYLYVWAASQQVEEQVAMGRRQLWQRRGATHAELEYAAWDINIGMVFSNLIVWAILFCTAAALHQPGEPRAIRTAAEAASALKPLAGPAAALLFTVGIVGVGFLAIPVMTTGAAYALADTFKWRQGLNEKPDRAREFYMVIVTATLLAMLMNFLHVNPMRALVLAGVIQGFIAPPLLILILQITRSRVTMGDKINRWWVSLLGWATAALATAASLALLASWLWRR